MTNVTRPVPPRKRGLSLGAVLLVSAIALVAGFALASGSLFHQHATTRVSNRERARDLAESAVAIAVQQVMDTAPPSVTTLPPTNVLLPGSEPDSSGTLTYDRNQADRPWSTYNLKSPDTIEGYRGRIVPGASVHLVGTGVFRGERRTIECVLYVPTYPYAMATAGRLQSSRALLVGGVPAGSGALDTIPADLLPGHVAANSTDSQAIHLGPQSLVTGDAQASGGVQLEGTGTDKAQILGEVRTSADPADLPQLDIAAMDPNVLTGGKGVNEITSDTGGGDPLTGYNRKTGDYTITGDLNLDRGYLYVNGNLKIHGAVKGTGAIVATGKVEVGGGARLTSDNVAAVVAGGDVSLTGTDPSDRSASTYQGLIYTGGRMTATDTTLVGVFVARPTDGGSTGMQIDNTQVVQSPDMSRIEFDVAMPRVDAVTAFKADGSLWVPGTDPPSTKAFGMRTQLKPNEASLPSFYDSAGHLKPADQITDADLNASYTLTDLANGTTRTTTTSDAMEAYLRSRGFGNATDLLNEVTTKRNAWVANRIRAKLPATGPPTPSTTTSLVSIDLSRFLRPEDNLRILWWKED